MAVTNRHSRSLQTQSIFKESVLQEEFESDQHPSIIASNIARLRAGQYSDFHVHAGSSKRRTFDCHRVILLVSSDYFRATITNSSSLTIKEVEPEEFEAILDYIYRGKIILTTLNVERILGAAHLLSLEDLKRGCVNFLLKTLDSDNCLRYWRWAKANDLPRLSEACRTLTGRDFYRVTASPDLLEIPEVVMLVILLDDELDVQSEVDVAETLLRWMEGQGGSKKDAVIFYDLNLLRKIRWSGVNDMYVRRRLLDNPRVSSDPAIREFLHRVLDFLSGGSPFAGLVTIHRPMTGIERCVFIVGAVTETSVSSEVIRLSLQRPEASIRDRVATQMRREAAACVCTRTNALFVSGIGPGYNEIWQWTGVGGWNRCDHMNQGRRRHSMVFANETSLFIVAGFAGSQFGLLGSVEKYDTRKECCLLVGDLVCPVDSAACIADFSVVYVFGGGDKDGNPVNHVQAFDTTRNVCSLLTQSLPRPSKLLRAVVWDRLVIVTSLESCFLYDLERQLWYPRPQFRSGRIHYGCVVENQRLYIFGGGNNVRDPNTGVFTWILSDQVRYVPVADIVEDKPAQWMGVAHHRLPIPCLVHAYAAVTAATGPRK